MRGMAALLAAGAAWTLTTRRIPKLPRLTMVTPEPKSLLWSLVAGFAAGLLALGLLAVPAAALGLGIIGASVPWSMARSKSRRQSEELADAWPDFLALLRSQLASGAALPESFTAAARRLSGPIADAADDIDNATRYGDGFVAAVERLRRQLSDPTADRVLITVTTAYLSGGQRVGELLSALAASTADELRLRKAHHSALTEQRLTALVALLAPWGLLALTVATNAKAADVY